MKCAAVIKEIGRGKDGARSLDREQARALWSAILAGEVSDLELGAVLLAMRVKGESCDELAGFVDATHAGMRRLAVPTSDYAPVIIASYNGARNMPNLVPLLALMLAERGVPVLVHGLLDDPMAAARAAANSRVGARVTTAAVFEALSVLPVTNPDDVDDAMQDAVRHRRPLFVPLSTLSPALHRILALRPILGVRRSGHTICKLLQPFEGRALRLSSYTHPEYYALLVEFFTRYGGEWLLGRGNEGEAVANPRRGQRLEWFDEGRVSMLVDGETVAPGELPVLPESREAAVTAVWIQSVLAGERPVPGPIDAQVEAIFHALTSRARSTLAAA
ncbi:DNA-binding protein YbiB [soil metagenome]